MACGGREGSREGGGREEIWGGALCEKHSPVWEGARTYRALSPPGTPPRHT